MTSISSIFSEAEIVSAALSVASYFNCFKINDVRKKLMADAGFRERDYYRLDQRKSKITGEKVSAILRAHPDLFAVRFAPNGRVHSFSKVGGAA